MPFPEKWCSTTLLTTGYERLPEGGLEAFLLWGFCFEGFCFEALYFGVFSLWAFCFGAFAWGFFFGILFEAVCFWLFGFLVWEASGREKNC
jgi:hypothetical protein